MEQLKVCFGLWFQRIPVDHGGERMVEQLCSWWEYVADIVHIANQNTKIKGQEQMVNQV